eukprot:m.27868 g.27868  ORF g.27868 m.27868 type:complete len:529 (-) comp7946_c0_seq2:244-1830(-)
MATVYFAIWVVELDGVGILPYPPEINERIEDAFRRKQPNVGVSFRTVGGLFDYDMKLVKGRSVDEALISPAGEQINLTSLVSRPIRRYNLTMLGSPNPAMWMYASVDTNPQAGGNKDEKQIIFLLFKPLVIVALEQKYDQGRTQALILEAKEQPYLVKFSGKQFTKTNIVTQQSANVKRVLADNGHVTEAKGNKATEKGAAKVKISIKEFNLQCLRRANGLYTQLTQVRLKETVVERTEVTLPTKSELVSFLAQVDGVDKMVVKDNKTLVTDSMWAALSDGVSGLSGPGAVALAKLSKMQLRYIFGVLMSKPSPISANICHLHLETLVDSWKSCIAEQVRAVDRLYGLLSGREMSFEQQVLVALDRYKDLVLEKLAIWMTTTVAKGHRVPHLCNRLRVEFATELGLSGVESAQQDEYIVPPLSVQTKQLALAKYYEYFNSMEFINSIIMDVNIQNESVERVIHPKTLLEFAVKEHKNGKLDQHKILYNEDEAEFYDSKPENEYDVFLHPGTALDVVQLAILRLLQAQR